MAKRSKKKRTIGVGVSAKVTAEDAGFQPARSWFTDDRIFGLILVLAVFAAYTPVWWAGYIWDDGVHLTANPCIVGPLGLKEIWTTSVVKFCPFVFTTFWVEHALWGLAPLPYHLVNVLLHGASAVLLSRVLRLLQIPGAWLGAALWSLHPVQVESVAWISEMKNTESALFFLLTILFFVRLLKAPAMKGPNGSGWNYALTLLFAFLAMASKSSTVVLPVVLGLVAWWIEGRWNWRHLKTIAPIFLMSVLAGALTIWNPDPEQANDPQGVQTWPERLVTAGDAVWFYLGKLVWPQPLITVYPRWAIDAGQLVSYLPLLLVVVVSIILWMGRHSWPRPYFLTWAFFLTALLPVLGLIDMTFLRYSFVADHFQYLASMGPLALAGAGLSKMTGLYFPRKPLVQTSLYAAVLLILGIWSWQRAWVYESQETLWTDALAKNPSCWAAYYNLGDALSQNGQVDEAMVQFQKALDINPRSTRTLYNLGNALLQKGQLDDAIVQFKRALEIDPNYAQAHNNLGNALFRKGQIDDAIVQYQKAVALKPDYAEAHNDLGNAFFRTGRIDEAIIECQKAVEINPDYAEARNNLGNALFRQGEIGEAVDQYQKALALNSNYAEAHNNLGNALLRMGQVDEAMAHYQQALEINHNYAEAHYNLGSALLRAGRVDEAMAQFQKTLDINPNIAEAHYNLGNAFVQKGLIDEGIAQFQEALRLRPGYGDALNSLAHARALAVPTRAGNK
jgi:tetratricopeptide (TPR) repeat protein